VKSDLAKISPPNAEQEPSREASVMQEHFQYLNSHHEKLEEKPVSG
jgi:hypothetical protein